MSPVSWTLFVCQVVTAAVHLPKAVALARVYRRRKWYAGSRGLHVAMLLFWWSGVVWHTAAAGTIWVVGTHTPWPFVSTVVAVTAARLPMLVYARPSMASTLETATAADMARVIRERDKALENATAAVAERDSLLETQYSQNAKFKEAMAEHRQTIVNLENRLMTHEAIQTLRDQCHRIAGSK